jgi:hypothetical protein
MQKGDGDEHKEMHRKAESNTKTSGNIHTKEEWNTKAHREKHR